MKYYVDPPEGWRWGFPKVWDEEVDGDMHTWIVDQGYPVTDLIKWSRMWEYTEEKDAEVTNT